MEVIEVYPTNCISIHAYFESLSFPPMFSIPHLLGKSNFIAWRAFMEPILLKNTYSAKLILGEWNEPKAQVTAGEMGAETDQARKDWQFANTATCRFIRATLALNVVPFVRQHSTAKALYLNLIWLYGEDGGIDTQGGPPVPSDVKSANPQRNRASLLAALESDRPLGDLFGSNLLSSPSSYPSSNSSTTSLLPKASTSSIAAGEGKRPDSQALPPKYLREITAQAPPPPSRIHIYERTRISPDPSLETIHEEPHPGQRVSFGRGGSSGSKDRSVSPISSSGASDVDDIVSGMALHLQSGVQTDKTQDLSPIEDLDDASHTKHHDESRTDTVVKVPPKSRVSTGTQKQSKTREKFSFSFPLRRLNKDKIKNKEQEKERK
ncbi:hypothetical protein EDD37DRAFT_440520 [Exophiala viscosa]|uniref:Uncharacterized protein n=1 Tax=Exophiala viscosa TaxID=2486360 RepID=A0AAN6IB50_9EURO|nr:hypothetical protein EDD36DRAFT_441278 [Exophiala viscosa]KAI1623795.1 hypothetical protein EDD37DRAFT_440520 [Exophiala viscosa]